MNAGTSVGQADFTGIKSSGRVSNPGEDTKNLPGFGYERKAENNFQADMLRGNWEHSPLSDAFFSQQNITKIQSLIRREVYDKSQPKGYIIDEQSVDELKIIMRALYYQYAKNLPYDISGQVEELNKNVIQWSVPHILSAVDHYIYYLKDIDTLPLPIAHPVHLSRSGTRSLPFNQFM
jgi:hypothetical protein